MTLRPPTPRIARPGFTLMELIASTAVLAILLMTIASLLGSVQRSWHLAKEKVDQFREARAAFEVITRQLSQATLNTYWDYHYPEGASAPAAYARQSELHFICGSASSLIGAAVSRPVSGHALFFQAPLGHSGAYRGLPNLLNGRGYYLQWSADSRARPAFLPADIAPARPRHRLMEYQPVAEAASGSGDAYHSPGNTIYTEPDSWFQRDLEKQSRVIASNILALIISPRSAREEAARPAWWLAPSYRYDSHDADNSTAAPDPLTLRPDGHIEQGTQHLLPPVVRVTLVAADEESFARWLETHKDAGERLLDKAGATFTDAASYEHDLAALIQYLDRQRIRHRVFTQAVPLRNAAWDRRQTPPAP